MGFPDFNIGYVFGYDSSITSEGFLITFLGGTVRIIFKFNNIETICRKTYNGGKISWDVIRWGKCPPGKEALKIVCIKGKFKNHMIVFNNLEEAIENLRKQGLKVADS